MDRRLHRLTTLDIDARDALALELFHDQAQHVPVYRHYLDLLGVDVSGVERVEDIPYLPIELFKAGSVVRATAEPDRWFRSSGTGGDRSIHAITDLGWYEAVSRAAYEHLVGSLSRTRILSLLPGYTQNPDSSLIHMVEHFKQRSAPGGRSLTVSEAADLLRSGGWQSSDGSPVLLIGVSFALLDLPSADPSTRPD